MNNAPLSVMVSEVLNEHRKGEEGGHRVSVELSSTVPRNSLITSDRATDLLDVSSQDAVSPDQSLLRTPTSFTPYPDLLPHQSEPASLKVRNRARAWSDVSATTCYSNTTIIPPTEINTAQLLSLAFPKHSIYSSNHQSETTIVMQDKDTTTTKASNDSSVTNPTLTQIGNRSTFKQLFFGPKEPKQLRATASESDIKDSRRKLEKSRNKSRADLNAINEHTELATTSDDSNDGVDNTKGRKSSTYSRKKRSSKTSQSKNAKFVEENVMVIMSSPLNINTTTTASKKKRDKKGKAPRNSTDDANRPSRSRKGTMNSQMDSPPLPFIGEESDDFNVQSSSFSNQIDRSRRTSCASTLAKNRRAYITKSIASAESLKRRESINTLAMSPTTDTPDTSTLAYMQLSPNLLQSLQKIGSPSTINSGISERPISVITSSFLDVEVTKDAPASVVSTEMNHTFSEEEWSAAQGRDYRAFIDALGNFRDSWLNEDEEELERLENERCASLLTLLKSEQKFVRMLRLLKREFITPLRQAAKKPGIYVGRSFSDKDISAVFGTVEKLLPVHEQLLMDLEKVPIITAIPVQLKMPLMHLPSIIKDCIFILIIYAAIQQLFACLINYKSAINTFGVYLSCYRNANCILRYHNFLQKMVDLYQPYDPEYLLIVRCSVKIQCLNDEYTQIHEDLADGKREYKSRINLEKATIEASQDEIVIITASGKEHRFKVEVANFHWQWVRHLKSVTEPESEAQ
ncbi:hypothetical protein BDF19DRAFT_417036 [Syncephalis fuscata]|nr:hypothetical protein BDF19DRAFT_417036 [Syncephalis fuscata]